MSDLLPPGSTPFERAMATMTARASLLETPFRQLWSADDCPLALLPFLAWALSIDGWDADWPEAIKRARVRQAIDIQRHKGTARSVRDVVRAFGGAIAIREWFDMTPPGEPHTFALVLALTGADGATATATFVDQVIAEVARTKPLRSHFTFTQSIMSAGAAGAIGAARPAVFARLALAAPPA